MKREFENLLREAAKALGLTTSDKVTAVNVGHQLDNLRDAVFTASGAQVNTLKGVVDQIQWLIDILDDQEVNEEWKRLFHEECQKPGNEEGLNAYQDWQLRRIAYDTVQKRKQGQL